MPEGQFYYGKSFYSLSKVRQHQILKYYIHDVCSHSSYTTYLQIGFFDLEYSNPTNNNYT